MATCESCGAPGETVFAVRRVYIIFGETAVPADETVVAEIEHWCFACCAQYPHLPAGDAPG